MEVIFIHIFLVCIHIYPIYSNECLLQSSLECCCRILNLFPLVLLSSVTSNIPFSDSSISLIILYTWITSYRILLYCKEGLPRCNNLSGYDRSLIDITSLVALLCTFSIALASFLYRGFQTVTAYSKCGRIRALYKVMNIDLSICMKDLFNRPNNLFIYLIMSKTLYM